MYNLLRPSRSGSYFSIGHVEPRPAHAAAQPPRQREIAPQCNDLLPPERTCAISVSGRQYRGSLLAFGEILWLADLLGLKNPMVWAIPRAVIAQLKTGPIGRARGTLPFGLSPGGLDELIMALHSAKCVIGLDIAGGSSIDAATIVSLEDRSITVERPGWPTQGLAVVPIEHVEALRFRIEPITPS